jgi:hypothetical protein
MAVLAFLTFQQARHLRRLREWAGRQPERALAAQERAESASAEATAIASGTSAREASMAGGPGRVERMRGEIAVRYEEADRRLPVDARWLIAGVLAIIVGVAIATSGFGLVGGGDDAPESTQASGESTPAKKMRVAVLNGTADESGVAVSGIADRVSRDVEAAGYRIGAVENADVPYPASVVMFTDGSKSDAKKLASDVEGLLGETEVEAMTAEIEALAGGADLALVVGQDDQGI